MRLIIRIACQISQPTSNRTWLPTGRGLRNLPQSMLDQPGQRLLAHTYRHCRATPQPRVNRRGHNKRIRANDQQTTTPAATGRNPGLSGFAVARHRGVSQYHPHVSVKSRSALEEVMRSDTHYCRTQKVMTTVNRLFFEVGTLASVLQLLKLPMAPSVLSKRRAKRSIHGSGHDYPKPTRPAAGDVGDRVGDYGARSSMNSKSCEAEREGRGCCDPADEDYAVAATVASSRSGRISRISGRRQLPSAGKSARLDGGRSPFCG